LQGADVALETAKPEGSVKPGVCFNKAEVYDVVDLRTKAKVAGAAQKRNSKGFLVQGSVDKGVLGDIDWERLEEDFAENLAALMGSEGLEIVGLPEVPEVYMERFRAEAAAV